MKLDVVLPCGVYFDRARHTAIVYKVGRAVVHYITMMHGSIEHRHEHAAQFIELFTGRWPAYPLRRAARLYLESQVEKSVTATRALRALLTQ